MYVRAYRSKEWFYRLGRVSRANDNVMAWYSYNDHDYKYEYLNTIYKYEL